MIKSMLGMLLLASTAMAQDPTPTSYPDVIEIAPPIVSIGSVYTSELLNNGQYNKRDERSLQWRLRDIQWQNKPYVQFQALNTQLCLTPAVSTTDCSDFTKTAFTLVPMDTGAFVLQSAIDGSCLVTRNYFRYDLEQCLRPSQLKKPIDLPYLWTIQPPFSLKAKLLKVPVK